MNEIWEINTDFRSDIPFIDIPYEFGTFSFWLRWKISDFSLVSDKPVYWTLLQCKHEHKNTNALKESLWFLI